MHLLIYIFAELKGLTDWQSERHWQREGGTKRVRVASATTNCFCKWLQKSFSTSSSSRSPTTSLLLLSTSIITGFTCTPSIYHPSNHPYFILSSTIIICMESVTLGPLLIGSNWNHSAGVNQVWLTWGRVCVCDNAAHSHSITPSSPAAQPNTQLGTLDRRKRRFSPSLT